MSIDLMEHQLDAIKQLSSGKILYGGVGAGKTATALGYYVENEEYRDIYVITTARKRDSTDWEEEAWKFNIGKDKTLYGKLHVDSWNNISNYEHITDAFFIFDEQRVVGHGSWVKSFLKICRNGNHWIMLSATPGDTWLDYAPVFIANGYYKNITDFKMKHVIYHYGLKFPKLKGYLNEEILEELRNEVLVEMPYLRRTQRHLNWHQVGYDEAKFNRIWKDRWNIYEDRPIKDAAELFRTLRKLINSDPSRLEELKALNRIHPRLVVFYNFDYELEILRSLIFEFTSEVYEWNGHKKDYLPEFEDLDRWIYLVQYNSGAEAWNCVSTDAMVLYSLTSSYRRFEQVQGRIDRMNTDFVDLFYYIFFSNSKVDRALKKALEAGKNFNERKFIRELDEKSVSYLTDTDDVRTNLERNGVSESSKQPLKKGQNGQETGSKLSPEELELLAKYGVSEEEFLGVSQI